MSEAWDRFINGIRDAFESVGSGLGEWLPKIVVAIVVLIVGRWIVRTLRNWITKLLESQAVDTLFDKAGLTAALEPSGTKPVALVATVAYAFLMLLLWLIIFRILEIDQIVDLLQRLIAVLPLIFVATALVLVAAAVGTFVADLVRPYAEQRQVAWLPVVVKVVVLLVGVLAALDLLEITFGRGYREDCHGSCRCCDRDCLWCRWDRHR